tara:strand:- start:6820 stop:7905 length:1086 start_codon:yes stop_codon:yes gene_type:complete
MNDQEIYQIIFSNFNESLKSYDNKSKSDFWIKFFDKSKISKINQLNLKNFRKPKFWGSKLSSGMDDDFEFFPTMEAYIQLLDTVKKKDILEYIELKVGNPKYYNIGGVDLNHHEISMFYSFNKISSYIKSEYKIVCEIGGGFGSLASKLKKKHDNLCIIIIDLPEAIILQSYYLLKLYPEKKFCFYNDFIKLTPEELRKNNYDFIIIPPWAKQKIINLFKIDYFINTHSFQEIDKEIVNDYFKFIHKTINENGIFYCLNKYSKIINNIPIKISEYPYDNYWELLSSETGWRNQNMHELIVKRVKHENISTKKIIQNLPKENSSISRSSTKLYIKLFIRKILDCFMFFIPKKILFKLFKMYS